MKQVLTLSPSQPLAIHLKHALQVILIGLFCILLGRYILDSLQLLRGEDFLADYLQYWTASKAISMGENPYTYLTQFGIFPYKYPPTFIMLLLPLTKLSFLSAQRVWIILNELMLWGANFLALKLIRRRMSIWQLLAAGCIALGFYPVYTSLKLGQVSILLYFLVVLCVWFWQNDKPVLAALALSLAGAVKVLPFLLLVYFLWKREYRLTLYTILFAGIFLILPDLLVHMGLLSQYVLSSFSWYNMENSYYANQSIFAFWLRLLQYVTHTATEVSTPLTLLGGIIACGLFAVTFFKRISRTINPDSRVTVLEIGIILTLIGLANPVSWTHYFVWTLLMVPAFISLFAEKYAQDHAPTSLLIGALGIIGFILFSQPFRIARLLGYDVEMTTLSLDLAGVLLQSVFLYGTLLIWESSSWLYHIVNKPPQLESVPA